MVLRLLALALGLEDSEAFAGSCDKPGHMSALRLNNYPAAKGPQRAGQQRAGEHSDYGAITLLHQGRGSDGGPAGGGLQIFTGSQWRPVPTVPGGLVVVRCARPPSRIGGVRASEPVVCGTKEMTCSWIRQGCIISVGAKAT